MKTSIFIFLVSMAAAGCTSIMEECPTGFHRFSNEHFSIVLPDGWIVWSEKGENPFDVANDVESAVTTTGFGEQLVLPKETEKTESWEYSVLKQNGGEKIFGVTIVRGGDPFILCLCAPREKYDYSRTRGYQVWSIKMYNGKVLTRKVASKRYRLDIHCVYGDRDPVMLDRVIESAWPAR